jgi:hypothetical protein
MLDGDIGRNTELIGRANGRRLSAVDTPNRRLPIAQVYSPDQSTAVFDAGR